MSIQSINTSPWYSNSSCITASNRTSAPKLDRLSQPLCKYVHTSMHACALANINRRMQRLYTPMLPSEHRHRCVIPREAHRTPVATQGRNSAINLLRCRSTIKNYYYVAIQINDSKLCFRNLIFLHEDTETFRWCRWLKYTYRFPTLRTNIPIFP